eukprot:31123-Pelagococcus_subviridis.AAC.2
MRIDARGGLDSGAASPLPANKIRGNGEGRFSITGERVPPLPMNASRVRSHDASRRRDDAPPSERDCHFALTRHRVRAKKHPSARVDAARSHRRARPSPVATARSDRSRTSSRAPSRASIRARDVARFARGGNAEGFRVSGNLVARASQLSRDSRAEG